MTQKEALDILKLGHNAFITGPAGSGKTHLLNTYIDYLREFDVDIGITASTGIAATHMGGVTIHSWSGLGIKSTLTDYDLEAMEEKKYLWKRMENVKVLIIDEVSMLHHFRLDLIERIIRSFKRNSLPFGGIQVILCGDFFQLPPVSRQGEEKPLFVYHSEAWQNAGFKICYLEEQFRQKDDACLSVLNDIRGNRVGEETLKHLHSRHFPNGGMQKGVIEATRLYTHNVDVDSINERELNKLSAETRKYAMTNRGNDVLVDILKKSCLAPAELRLKVGARVMFVKNNFDKGYVNGTLGRVKSFSDAGNPVVETNTGLTLEVEQSTWVIEEEGKIKAEISQYPLRLAWAITVHKSQGMSLDAVEVDLSKSFEKGMGYVALSRVRTLAGLTLLGWNENALKVNEEVLEMDEELRVISENHKEELHAQTDSELERGQMEFLKKVASPETLKEVFGGGKEGRASRLAKRSAGVKKRFSRLKKKIKEGIPVKVSTIEQTKELLLQKMPLGAIAKERGMTEETIISHIEKILEEDPKVDIEFLRKEVPRNKIIDISKAFEKMAKTNEGMHLAPIKNIVGANVSYRDIRLARLFMKYP
ncbi:MAG: AAA family ATPase [Candidatus Taylorbacteria bacterium]|nr:AAA family ATPase [Candidatus Taylorbacteria bacterium]